MRNRKNERRRTDLNDEKATIVKEVLEQVEVRRAHVERVECREEDEQTEERRQKHRILLSTNFRI